MPARVSIIAALGKNRAIGKNNELLWRIPADLARFKTLTMGHPVIMGRRTFCSILSSLGKPLPGRTNIVLTKQQDWSKPGALVVCSIEKAFRLAKSIEDRDIFIGGGARVYEEALPFADRLYLTLIDEEKEADAYFPEYEHIFRKVDSLIEGPRNGLPYRFVVLEK